MSEDNRGVSGGSGGDGNPTKDEYRLIDGTFSVTGNQVELVSRPALPPAPPKPCLISLLATDIMQLKGSVNLHGMGGINVTTGPPPLPPMDANTEGVLMQCGEIQ